MKSGILKASVLASCVLLGGTASAAGDVAAGDAAAGKIKAQPCMGCHGIPGYNNVYPTYHVPKLGGQWPEYLVTALKAYRDELRGHKTMQAQAKSMSEQDMADIAAFFASVKRR